MVWVRRALLGLTMAAVAGGGGLAWAVGASAETATAAAKKHVPAKGSKTQTKSSGMARRAPAASFAKKPVKGKKGRAVTASHAHTATASRGMARTASAGVVHADLERPSGGREATVARITEELASTKVGIEYPRALRPFFDQLIQLEADPKASLVRVIQFGDSHTAADLFTGALRQLFQTKFGDGGAGFQFAGYPFAGYRIHGTKRAQSTGWIALGTHLRDIGDGLVGMGGVSLSTEGAGNWVSVDADATSLEVQYLLQPSGGEIEIYDGEKLLGTVATNGPEGAGHYDATVEAGPHHFEVRTIDRAPVRLLGLVTANASGATYEAAGINGAEASLFLRWNEGLAQTLMAVNAPALIVLSYGTNEAGDHNWTEDGYAEMFRRIVARCRRMAPNASILVVGPPDRALRAGRRGWAPFAGVDRIVAAQKSVCRELGCAYWDQRKRMGGFGSMRDWVSVQWAQGDHTHFTTEGYDELASALFSDLVQQYSTYRGVQGLAQGEAKTVEGKVQ
jgi:lysophospholipase L1-like esterase